MKGGRTSIQVLLLTRVVNSYCIVVSHLILCKACLIEVGSSWMTRVSRTLCLKTPCVDMESIKCVLGEEEGWGLHLRSIVSVIPSRLTSD